MFGFLKGARERRARETAERTARHHILRLRLYETLDRVAVTIIEKHDLSNAEAIRIRERVDLIKQGIDIVLIDQIEWSDSQVTENLRGGAIIANSAEAYSTLAMSLGKPELEDVMGSVTDREVLGHMCYQLGYSRDGNTLRPVNE